MMKQLKPVGMMFMVFVLVLAFAPGVIAGDLEPPAGPEDAGSAMYTLEDAYNRLDTGEAGVKRTGGFTEPSSEPGSTGVTLDQVMEMMPAADDTNGTSPEEVAAGKTYWGLRTDGTWGHQTGTSTTCATCSGTLSVGGRWCDQGNGTVKDMITGLVWLQDASWGGSYAFWVDTMNGTNAHDRAAQVRDGNPASLTDGSVEGDWRLPTKEELHGLAHGTEAIRSGSPAPFTGVQSSNYWSSTTYATNPNFAWYVYLGYGHADYDIKNFTFYVWPVRAGQ
jgi:hypothetical protein